MFQTSQLKQHFTYCDIPVNFAGLVGTTRDMVKHGWELNLHSDRLAQSHGVSLSFTGIHRALSLRIVSARFVLDYYEISRMPIPDIFRYLSNAPVRISACSENIMISLSGKINQVASTNWSGDFGFADPITVKNYSFDEIFHFPTRDSTVMIREDKIWTIEEHLNAIRKAQEPTQDEILRGMDLTRKTSAKLQLIGIA